MSKVTKTEQSQVVDSQVKVNLPPQKAVVIERRISPEAIAKDITSRVMGKTLDGGDIFDPKSQRFLNDSELVAKGAVFVTVALASPVKNMNKTSRADSSPNPYLEAGLVKKSTFQLLINIDWKSYINRRNGDNTFIPEKKASNNIKNFFDCRGVGEHDNGNFFVKGIVLRSIKKAEFVLPNGDVVAKETLADYLPKKNRKNEAAKHGIAVEFDPQFRSAGIGNCEYIRAFGFEYRPTENPNN